MFAACDLHIIRVPYICMSDADTYGHKTSRFSSTYAFMYRSRVSVVVDIIVVALCCVTEREKGHNAAVHYHVIAYKVMFATEIKCNIWSMYL